MSKTIWLLAIQLFMGAAAADEAVVKGTFEPLLGRLKGRARAQAEAAHATALQIERLLRDAGQEQPAAVKPLLEKLRAAFARRVGEETAGLAKKIEGPARTEEMSGELGDVLLNALSAGRSEAVEAIKAATSGKVDNLSGVGKLLRETLEEGLTALTTLVSTKGVKGFSAKMTKLWKGIASGFGESLKKLGKSLPAP